MKIYDRQLGYYYSADGKLTENDIRNLKIGDSIEFLSDLLIGGTIGTVPKGSIGKIMENDISNPTGAWLKIAFSGNPPYSYPNYSFGSFQLVSGYGIQLSKTPVTISSSEEKVMKEKAKEKEQGKAIATGAIEGVLLIAAIKTRLQVASTIGLAAGLVFAYTRHSKVGGYIGWGILFSVVGSGLAILSAKIIKPKSILKLNDKPNDKLGDKPNDKLNDKLYVLIKNFEASTMNINKQKAPEKNIFDSKINALSNADKQIALEIAQAMDSVQNKYKSRTMNESNMALVFGDLEKELKKVATKYGEEKTMKVNEFMQTMLQ